MLDIVKLVLINYIKGETDAKNYTLKNNRTILIDDNGNRIYFTITKLEILSEFYFYNEENLSTGTV